MATRFDRYYEKQMENANVRAAVEKELASLDLGIQIARAREAKHMNQTQLAAKAGMNASKISRIENSAQNLTLNTSRSQVHQNKNGGHLAMPAANATKRNFTRIFRSSTGTAAWPWPATSQPGLPRTPRLYFAPSPSR